MFRIFDRSPFSLFSPGAFDRPAHTRRVPLLVRLLDLLMAVVLLLVAVLIFSAPARAAQCNTIFLTDKNGNISFPFCPPNRATGAFGTIDNMGIGLNVPGPGIFTTVSAGNIVNNSPTPIVQGAPNAQTVSATLTAANLSAGLITVAQGSGANSNLQLPLGTAMDTAFPNAVVNSALDFSVINIGGASETATITTNTGWTLVGGVVIAVPGAGADSSVLFRARKTGVGTWVLYRRS